MNRSQLLAIVKAYIQAVVKPLNRDRYMQESAYVDAFLGRLDGEIDLDGSDSTIIFTPTVVADRGRGTAESKFGADFAIVFESNGIEEDIKKAILGQAKNGEVDSLNNTEKKRLLDQCSKMASVTKQYMVLEAPMIGNPIPTIRIGLPIKKGLPTLSQRIPFDEYLVDYIISCTHGDRRKEFIEAVGHSKLPTLGIVTNNLTLEPDPAPRRNMGM